jgi:hypothetical protein
MSLNVNLVVAPFGAIDEGVAFGLLVGFVFLFVTIVEYVRAKRAKATAMPKEQYANAAVWGVTLTLAAGGYVVAPNVALRHDISILLTCGAAFQALAFGLLWIAPRRCKNVSLPRAPADFALLMANSLVIRLAVEMKWNGYLPIDRTGDGCIQILEFIALMLTMHGLGQIGVEMVKVKRAALLAYIAYVFGQFCYGDLDGNRTADKAFAISIYSEVFAWACMARYVLGIGKDAVTGMVFPLIFIQAMCRAYFWYVAIPETKVRAPVNWLQTEFNWVLCLAHVVMGLLGLVLSVHTVREIKPSLPHELLTPDPSFLV